jgi:hypothetical protein
MIERSLSSKLMSRIFRLILNRPIFSESNLSFGFIVLMFRRNKQIRFFFRSRGFPSLDLLAYKVMR